MPVTIQDIAQSLNLSHTTVSRVLNARQDQFISQATRERVWSRARELGYRPNRAARALVTGRTQQIALWMSSIYTAFHAQLIHEVETQVSDTDYQLMIGALNTTRGSLEQWHVDGYLVFEGMAEVQTLLGSKRLEGAPLVSMGGTNFLNAALDYVGLDLQAGTEQALRHLVETGCQRIAFVGERLADSRRQRYTQFMQQRDRTPEFIDIPRQNRTDVRAAVRAYVTAHGCPDGLFCFNDDVALASYRALRDLGLRVPTDVALVGCDGIEEAEYLDTPLSTLVLPVTQMCQVAWQFLQKRIEEPKLPPQQTMLQPTLVLRESTRR